MSTLAQSHKWNGCCGCLLRGPVLASLAYYRDLGRSAAAALPGTPVSSDQNAVAGVGGLCCGVGTAVPRQQQSVSSAVRQQRQARAGLTGCAQPHMRRR